MNKGLQLLVAACLASGMAGAAPSQHLADWPHVTSAVKPDPAIEARVKQILASMTLRQKIGQMTQAEIQSITPDEARRYYIGSVLNGGGSWPDKNKHASAADWVALADRFHAASMATDMVHKVPLIWGIDAIHGNSNIYGATLFPHNIALGAAHDPALARRVGAAVGRAVRATGMNWVFGPTVAVVRDDRWGRTYESFSEDPALVKAYAAQYVRGLQGDLRGPANVLATAKHFMGDGGTDGGKDQGVNLSTRDQMINIHGQGYYSALAAGAQTVMASYNSWNDVAAGVDYGKMHGSKAMLTDALKDKMGFDGFVVSDWNGVGQVPGCRDDGCAQAINAGIDMVMVPSDWKAFIDNTVRQVERSEIPMARIDDAVTRILRVKLRSGMFGQKPSANPFAGKADALQDRALARELVRKSMVLLKNDAGTLPLARGRKILVVGEGADSMPMQVGGWSLTWQGNNNTNADFPNGDTILAGIEEQAGKDNVVYRADASGVDVSRFDAVIAVVGESPSAEFNGDIDPTGNLRHSSRFPQDLAVLQAVAGKGKPVVTVFLSGRPLYVNDLLNLSDSFVAAWLPGTEGKGVADVLFRPAQGKPAYGFGGTLSFSWPKSACQTPLNVGDKGYAPLFPVGYGLRYGKRSHIGKLDEDRSKRGCGGGNAYPVYVPGNRAAWPLAISGAGQRLSLGRDLASVVELPAIKVEVTDLSNQQDGKLVTWSGPARFEASRARPAPLPDFARTDGALQFDVLVKDAPTGKIRVGFGKAAVDVRDLFAGFAGKGKQTVRIPLSCFGVDTAAVDTVFSVESEAPFKAAFSYIMIAGGAAAQPGAVPCAALH
ncbi:MAG TPA: glycoside hydrolase family 3 N-terminal domain-containing protein [Telluria sp.]|nr:glycoside hydrolase family 3 N-terminal domain-containing protein [Telluria sp.]